MTEMPPAGLLTVTSMAGNGWTCGTTACTRSNALYPGSSYPPITVTVTVAEANVPSLVTNTASVSGGGSATANASDPTTISSTGSTNIDYRDNGRDDALLYDPVSGTAYVALSNGNGTYSYVYNFFNPGFDTLRPGDFNGDGKADLVLYNSKTAAAYIGMGNGNGTFNFQSLFWSPGYNIVEPGDINGDGMTDFALYNGLTGTLYTGISNGDGTFTYWYHLTSMGFTFIRLADFSGDGLADLFLYNAADGTAFLGVGDGAGNFAFNPLFISPGYNLADIGDLNGDGKADVILYNSTSGNAATGIGNGTGGFTFVPLIFSPGFASVRLADYTGDGKAGVTVYNKNSAVGYFGTGNGDGTFTFGSLFWSPGYDYVIAEDLTDDGKMDVILYNSATGTEYTGIGNGASSFAYTYRYWGIGKILDVRYVSSSERWYPCRVWWRLRLSEYTLIAFFSYIAIVALLFSLPHGLKYAGFPVAACVIVACVGLADCERRSGSQVFSMVRDWLPLAFTLLAYREMNWFAAAHQQHTLEQAWVVWDRWLLQGWGMTAPIEACGWLIPLFLEFCYLCVYAVGPFTVGILYGYHRRDLIDSVLMTYLLGTLLAYGLFPYFPSDPPRIVFAGMDLPGITTPLRRLNLAILGGYGIHSSVFPSAHVSSAFSAAWGLLVFFPERRRVGWGMLLYAACVSVATVYGRYHYAADAAAGVAISGAPLLAALAMAKRRRTG